MEAMCRKRPPRSEVQVLRLKRAQHVARPAAPVPLLVSQERPSTDLMVQQRTVGDEVVKAAGDNIKHHRVVRNEFHAPDMDPEVRHWIEDAVGSGQVLRIMEPPLKCGILDVERLIGRGQEKPTVVYIDELCDVCRVPR